MQLRYSQNMSKEEIFSTKSVSEPVVRLAILGAPKVGKSAISVRFLTRRYISEYQPSVENNYVKEIFFGEDLITYELKDTANQVDVLSHIAWATCIAVVYSIDDRFSFTLAEDILKLIDSFLSNNTCEGKNTSLCYALISNKNDLDHLRVIASDEGKEMAKRYRAGFWEMSAADNYESTYGPIRAMIIEAFFSTTNKPINPVPQNINKNRTVDDLSLKNNTKNIALNQLNKKFSQDSNNNLSRKTRKPSRNEGFKKNSLGHLLLENFAMNDLAFAVTNGPDTPDEQKEIERSLSKKDKFRSSIKRERFAKPTRKLGMNQNAFDIRENEKDSSISDTDSFDSNSVNLNSHVVEIISNKIDAKTDQENIISNSPAVSQKSVFSNSPAVPQKSVISNSPAVPQKNVISSSSVVPQTNLKNLYNKKLSTVPINNDNNSLANWNTLMLGPEYDLCRIFKGRPEKKSTRMKISAIFKQANL